MIDEHHHEMALPVAVEHVARHGARVLQQAGLDMRVAGDACAEQAPRIVPSAPTTGSDDDEFRHHCAFPGRLQDGRDGGGARALVARQPGAVLHHQLRRLDASLDREAA